MPADKVWVLDRNLGLNQRANPSTSGLDGYLLTSQNTGWLSDGLLSLRRGTESQSLTSSGFTGDIKWCGRHVTNTGLEELWAAASNAGTAALARRSAGTWAAVTYSDTVTVANLLYHHSATLNGKLFLAYDSDVNRLHVWDGSALRRVGILKPSAPTVADTGAGAYAATARRYRTAQRIKSGSDVIAQSELSDAVSFTPSGAGTAARITKSATVDSATHWVVFGLLGSVGDVYDLYEEIAEVAVGTTTYDDSTAPASYDGDFPPQLGVNIPPPSCKYLLADGTRLLLANAWETSGSAGETTPKQNRVWFTRRLGVSDQGDDESIPNTTTLKYFIDIGDAGPITGLFGPIYGEVYVTKQRSIWKLIPTGDDDTPYRAVIVSDTAGALDQRLIAMIGDTAAAFADESAVYYVSANSGPVVLSDPIGVTLKFGSMTAPDWMAYDQWDQKLLLMNGTAAGAGSNGRWFAVDKRRWGTFVLASGATLNRGVMAANDTGVQRLHLVGKTVASASLLLAAGFNVPNDNGTALTGLVRVRLQPAPGCTMDLFAPTIWYRAPDSVGPLSLTITYTKQGGASDSQTATLPESSTLVGSTTYEVNDLQLTDCLLATVAIQVTGGGAGDVTDVAAIDRIEIPYKEHVLEPRS